MERNSPKKPTVMPAIETLFHTSVGLIAPTIAKVISGAVPMISATWPAVSLEEAIASATNGSTCPTTDRVAERIQIRNEDGQRHPEKAAHTEIEAVATTARAIAIVSGSNVPAAIFKKRNDEPQRNDTRSNRMIDI